MNRSDTPEFRTAAVQQVTDGGRSIPAVARSSEMSAKTLANWALCARGSRRPRRRPESQRANWKRG
ncbi:transposase [Accumulibacter sp.]|uniref:transposase n=1 Tax=Accumulibacter sp. TaxID=2053492 RepID=UPI00341E05E1